MTGITHDSHVERGPFSPKVGAGPHDTGDPAVNLLSVVLVSLTSPIPLLFPKGFTPISILHHTGHLHRRYPYESGLANIGVWREHSSPSWSSRLSSRRSEKSLFISSVERKISLGSLHHLHFGFVLCNISRLSRLRRPLSSHMNPRHLYL